MRKLFPRECGRRFAAPCAHVVICAIVLTGARANPLQAFNDLSAPKPAVGRSQRAAVAKTPPAGPMKAAKKKVYRHYGYAKDASSFKDALWKKRAYATTAAGRPMSGRVAQDKLALKHPEPPDCYYLVTIDPKEITVRGPTIERPCKNPPRKGGGGVYFFPNGTPAGSVTGPFRIPK